MTAALPAFLDALHAAGPVAPAAPAIDAWHSLYVDPVVQARVTMVGRRQGDAIVVGARQGGRCDPW